MTVMVAVTVDAAHVRSTPASDDDDSPAVEGA